VFFCSFLSSCHFLTPFSTLCQISYRTRTRQAVRAAGGRIPLSFDYVISAEHTEHYNTSSHTGEGSDEAETVFTAAEKTAQA